MQIFDIVVASDTFSHASMVAHDAHAQFRNFTQLDLSTSLKQGLSLIMLWDSSWNQKISFA